MIKKIHKAHELLLTVICCGAIIGAITFLNSTFFFINFSLDRYIAQAIKDWQVPGLAIAIVQDDKVVHIKGYGVLKEGEKDRVNEQTLFAIGSCTKEFTAAALAILVDDGVLTWDTKAQKHLPQLQLYDECITKQLDILDMLSHRSGLEEVGMLWDHTSLSRQELMQRIRFLKPITGFREGWVYNNLMYLSAGEIIPAITGMSWDDFIIQRIFKPLNMNRSSTTITVLSGQSNVTTPHFIDGNNVRAIPYHNIDSISAAGGINSTISDMAQWLKMVINKGLCDGKRLLSEETINELYDVQSIVKKDYPYQFYGLGLGTFDYQGSQVVFHEGNIDGMSASIAFLPAKKVGVVILTNMHRGKIGKVLMNVIFDRYLSVKNNVDWNTKVLKEEQERKEKFSKEEQEKQRNRVLNTSPTYSLQQYVGTYQNTLYGDVIVTLQGNELTCRFLQFNNARLVHWQNDTFTFDPSSFNPVFTSPFYVAFVVDDKKVTALSIEYADTWLNDMKAEFIKK